MSFRLFIYYCAICGGCAAYLGWLLGLLPPLEGIPLAGIRGLFVGMMVALGLSLVDSLWNLAVGRVGVLLGRVFVAVLVGCLGGLLGGVIGQAFFKWTLLSVSIVFGWTITGLLIGVSVGAFDVLASLSHRENLRGAQRKLFNGMIGGTTGGLLGGSLYVLLDWFWGSLFKTGGQSTWNPWSPGATGFVALGMCIGLLIGLAQIILKEAWLKVEAGFRTGRELLLERQETTIGRAEGCDLGLFGDPKVDKLHARIVHEGNDFVLNDVSSTGGTFVNDERVKGPRRLRSGDLIRVGRCLLRFGERQKREE
jgi:hypothetical protein